MPEYRIKPGGMHAKFHASTNKIQIIGGGFGNGKSAAGVVKVIGLCKKYPGCNGLVAMATYAQLNDTIREEFYKWVPPSSVKRWPTMADNTLIFKNGSKVNFRYIQQKGKQAADGQTSSNLLSATYDFVLIDQVENPLITYKDFLDVLGRLRGSTAYKGSEPHMPKNGPRWLMLLANPSFNWVFHKLIKPMKRYKETGEIGDDLIVDVDTKEPLIDLFEASTYENKHNLEPDFIKTMEAAYTGQFRDRYLGGEWGAFEGLIYPQFKQNIHMFPRHVMEKFIFAEMAKGKMFTAVEGFDFGIASPSCYLSGFKDDKGRVFIMDGFYEKEMALEEIGDNIVSVRRQDFGLYKYEEPIIADPAIWKRTVVAKQGKGADTIKTILEDSHDLNFKPGQNDILNGIAKVGSYLNWWPIPHPFNPQMNKSPLIFFASHLHFIADEFGSYFWKSEAGERVDKPIDRNDHAMDVIKYMLSTLPEASTALFSRSYDLQEIMNGLR